MPSFASFLKHSTRKKENQNQDGKWIKRRSHFLNILRRRRSQRDVSSAAGIKLDESPATQLSPVLAVDSNKPLPPPPNPEPELGKVPKRQTIRLDRIISPLTAKEINKLFSGAPQFHVRSGINDVETLLPTVDFPWNDEPEVKHLIDHKQIEHLAWKCSSTYSRVPEGTTFPIKVRERPNVLSLQGLETGTVGFAAALEFQVSDATQANASPSIENDSFTTKENTGVRPLDEFAIIERLSEIGEFYHRGDQRPSNVELYTSLFTTALFPPARVRDVTDPYSLTVQIEELLNVLSSAEFLDLSIVELRIRLGQILWGFPESAEEDDRSITGGSEDGPIQDKTWLLIQILLSSELLIRLDFVPRKADDAQPDEMRLFNKRVTPAINWGLLLARSWLHNIKVNIPADSPVPEKKPESWLSSLMARGESNDDPGSLLSKRGTFEWRHADLQLSGLLTFAHQIKWGNIDDLASRCLKTKEEINASSTEIKTSQLGTPGSTDTRRSYFSISHPGLQRNPSQQQRIHAIIHPEDWISSSYFSGVILPGEPLSHLLMGTLLENDGKAMGVLGEETTLYGGFIYAQRSYWSLFCIVGRVLAAEADAAECMGWVSSSIIPQGLSDRWVDIEVQDVIETSSQARIWQGSAIESESRVTGDGDDASTFSSDFIFVPDLPENKALDVVNPQLALSLRADSTLTTPTVSTPGISENAEPSRIQSYTAQISFDVAFDESVADDKKSSSARDSFTLTCLLLYDVRFVAAVPCIAPTNISSILPPSSGEQIGHPLHKIYTYSHQPLSSIIQSQLKGEVTRAYLDMERVLIIDCTSQVNSSAENSNSSLDILARAYCSENGFNALISRKGRTCLSCSIREAKALDFRVIIRVGT